MSLGGGGPPRVQSGPLFGKHGSARSASGPFPAKTTSPSKACDAAARATAASSGKFDFREIRGDLFQCPSSASLAHCVSEDMRMGRGIAKIFKNQFGGVEELKKQGG